MQAVKQASRVEYLPEKRSVRCQSQKQNREQNNDPKREPSAASSRRSSTETRAERRVFTEEFKRDAVRLAKERDAVRLAKERGNVSQVARDLGIHESVLTRWRRRLEEAPERPFPGQGNPQDPELARLRRENTRLREDNEILKNEILKNEILKKAVGIFTVRPQ